MTKKIDQKYFCANCFDNKTHKEASSTKFKCMNCFTCPCCKNSLNMRASNAQKAAAKAAAAAAAATSVSSSPQSTNAQVTSTQGTSSTEPSSTQQQQTPQKVYYLSCAFCRWTTRDVGIPDVLSS
jgi:dynactin-4